MNAPSTVFSEEEKAKFQEIARVLERELDFEGKESNEIAMFSKYPPLVEAIRLAKSGDINAPLEIPNMSHWYFESPLGEWFHFSKSKARRTLSDFMRLISGFPLIDVHDDPSKGASQ